MLLGRVIGIITEIVTYNEMGLFYKTYKDVLNGGILPASLARKVGRYLSNAPTMPEYGTRPFYNGDLAQVKTHVKADAKILGSVGILLIGRLKRQAINLVLQSSLRPSESWGPSQGGWAFQTPLLGKSAGPRPTP